MELTISERFPGLNPISIRREKAKEVFLLIRRLKNDNKIQRQQKKSKRRKPAGDNWF